MHQASRRSVDTRWLDGVRGFAALFVLFHHLWLGAWPGFPEDRGPALLSPLLYGHLAVCVFIVLSGFSLALKPLRDRGHLTGGTLTFLRRRAWRLLPAYWASLIISIIVLQLTSDTTAEQALKAMIVHGLLLQDVVGSVRPNGTFWSIAVEWHIYLVFPVMLLLVRRGGVWLNVVIITAVVVSAYLASGHVPLGEKVLHLSPQMYVLFAMGVLAAKVTTSSSPRWTGVAVSVAAVVLTGSVVMAAAVLGSARMVTNFFWVDLVFGAGVAASFAAIAVGRLVRVRYVLGTRVLTVLGAFAYSLYLMQAPVLEIVPQLGVEPAALSPVQRGILWLVLVPVVCSVSWVFYLFFERPFLLERSFGGFRHMPGLGRHVPVPVPAPRSETDASAAGRDEQGPSLNRMVVGPSSRVGDRR